MISDLALSFCFFLTISAFRKLSPDSMLYRHTTDVSQQHTDTVCGQDGIIISHV